MMIVSAKVSKKKLLTGVLVAVGVILLLVFLSSKADSPGDATTHPQEMTNDAATNEQRLAFLQRFGWEVEDAPTETQEVRIPAEFNDVFTRYNELQKSQGYDLSQFAGKAAKRYVYRITNHPMGNDYFATVLIHKNEIIGGDVTGTGSGGTMHGFAMPDQSHTGSTVTPRTAA